MTTTIETTAENQEESAIINYNLMVNRFRGYYPVVIDIETAGFNPYTDAILEIAAAMIDMDEHGNLSVGEKLTFNVKPFEGANLDPASLKFTGIDVKDPNRNAVDETYALTEIFKVIRQTKKKYDCKRAIIVAHNAAFDLSFLNAAIERQEIKRNPFHPFAMLDTATISGVMLGQTVLAKACETSKIEFDHHKAHTALYDTEKAAELFCLLLNHLKKLGGFPFVDIKN